MAQIQRTHQSFYSILNSCRVVDYFYGFWEEGKRNSRPRLLHVVPMNARSLAETAAFSSSRLIRILVSGKYGTTWGLPRAPSGPLNGVFINDFMQVCWQKQQLLVDIDSSYPGFPQVSIRFSPGCPEVVQSLTITTSCGNKNCYLQFIYSVVLVSYLPLTWLLRL